MPEIQKSTQIGEVTQRFIEFVMMQAQQAALFLGRIPNPQTGQPQVNLEYARLFIDQLEMIREKTRGNLSSEESEVLTGVLADLQLAYVQASGSPVPSRESTQPPENQEQTTHQEEAAPKSDPAVEAENKKKFTKSYGS